MQTEVHFFLSAFLLDPILFPLNILAKSGKNNHEEEALYFSGFQTSGDDVHCALSESFFGKRGSNEKLTSNLI